MELLAHPDGCVVLVDPRDAHAALPASMQHLLPPSCRTSPGSQRHSVADMLALPASFIAARLSSASRRRRSFIGVSSGGGSGGGALSVSAATSPVGGGGGGGFSPPPMQYVPSMPLAPTASVLGVGNASSNLMQNAPFAAYSSAYGTSDIRTDVPTPALGHSPKAALTSLSLLKMPAGMRRASLAIQEAADGDGGGGAEAGCNATDAPVLGQGAGPPRPLVLPWSATGSSTESPRARRPSVLSPAGGSGGGGRGATAQRASAPSGLASLLRREGALGGPGAGSVAGSPRALSPSMALMGTSVKEAAEEGSPMHSGAQIKCVGHGPLTENCDVGSHYQWCRGYGK